MKTVYIDADYKCHVTNDGTMTAVEEKFFADKCDTFIEGFRLKPDGEIWVREDGVVFSGSKMISPWKPYAELENAQRVYERELLAELQANSIPISELEDAYQEGVNSAYD